MQRGLGDTIASVADIIKNNLPFKLENCNCEKRRVLLNEIFPYKNVRRGFEVAEEFIIRNESFKKGSVLEVDLDNKLAPRIQYLVEKGKLKEINL
jgi:hypothetical protein